MHPVISNEDIVYTERIIFGERGKFDQERKDFIKNLDSIDLQAVPGSGKTTALLAKLLILQKNQPLLENAGILVISHTNKAVDIIKKKIGLHCPNLFSYPNYVGTIQGFVDHFLANSALINIYRVPISKVDTELYQIEILKKYYSISFSKRYNEPGKLFWGRNFNRAKEIAKRNGTNKKEECKQLIAKEVSQLYLDLKMGAICRWDTGEVIIRDENNPRYQGLRKIIEEILQHGIISYEYAYHFGDYSLLHFTRLKKIIQKRFRFVFVDEMQDMEAHQIDILDNLFRLKKIKNHVFQRVGDNNQSIFSGLVHEDSIWVRNENLKTLRKSIRLSSLNAQIVEPFGIKQTEIVGFNQSVNENPIKPHLILFDDQSIRDVIPQFAKSIKKYQNEEKIPCSSKNVFKAVGWVKEKKSDEKLAIKDYFPSYNIEITRSTSDLNCLEDYIFRAEKENTSKAYSNALIESTLKILKLEDLKSSDGRFYTKTKLIKFMRYNENPSIQKYYDDFLLELYQMCSICIKSDIGKLRPKFLDYITKFLKKVFGKDNLSDASMVFLKESRVPNDEDDTEFFEDNFYRNDELSIEVGTVHSVKGETHCATLYLETFYQRKHESERLLDQLKGNSFDDDKTYHKQSTKVAYVGLSRPTHFLCFAAHFDRVKDHLVDIERNGWVIDKELITD